MFFTYGHAKRLVGEGEVIEIAPGIDHIPLFVKDGGMIAMTSSRLHTPAKEEIVPLTIRHHGNMTGTWQLYDDDGETFAYEKGDLGGSTISVTQTKDRQKDGRVDKGKVFKYEAANWVFMTR